MSFKSMRANRAVSSGKRYVEFVVEQKGGASSLYVGIDSGSNNYVYPGLTGIGENTLYSGTASYKSTGAIYSRTSSLTTGTSGIPASQISEGDIISMLVDFDLGQLSFWRNGVHQSTLPYPVSTSSHPVVSLGGSDQRITINLSQSTPFVHTAPSGYTDWAGNPI